MKSTAQIIQFKNQRQSEFVCSACGADRYCNCNAPALERLADLEEKKERERQQAREKMRRKREKDKQNQCSVTVTDDENEEWNEEVGGHQFPPAARLRGLLWRAERSAEYANTDFMDGCDLTIEVREAVRKATKAWNALLNHIEGRG